MEAISTNPALARAETRGWIGTWHPLLRQIAPAGRHVQSRPTTPGGATLGVTSANALSAFLCDYKQSVLLPYELPAVLRACEHLRHQQMQELLALDAHLAAAPWLDRYRADSREAGRLHLQRLKPLRDHRGLRRYREAVESAQANGWHLLVAGMALALYSIPLRQGLMDYALDAFWNAVEPAAGPLGLKGTEAAELVRQAGADLPGRIQQLLPFPTVTAL